MATVTTAPRGQRGQRGQQFPKSFQPESPKTTSRGQRGQRGQHFPKSFQLHKGAEGATQTPFSILFPTYGEKLGIGAPSAPSAPQAKDAAQQPALFPAPGKPTSPTPQTGMPDWLRRALEDKTGGFRAAHWDRCPRCQQITLKGLDADTAAFTVTADPTPITARQETLCAAVHRPTYLLQQIGPRIELSHRDAYSIGQPSRLGPIIPAHHCGARFPGFHHPRPQTGTADHDDPPF